MVTQSETSRSPELSPVDHMLLEAKLPSPFEAQSIPWFSRDPFGSQRTFQAGAFEETSPMDADEIFEDTESKTNQPQISETTSADGVFERNYRELVLLLDGKKANEDRSMYLPHPDLQHSQTKASEPMADRINVNDIRKYKVNAETKHNQACTSVKKYDFEQMKMERSLYSKKRRKSTPKRPRSKFSCFSDQSRSLATNSGL